MQKQQKIRLKGKPLAALNAELHQRDGGCVMCGLWVDQGEKFHHEPCGINKQDRIDCGVVLCKRCHYERHFGKNSVVIKKRIEEYLFDIYKGKDV